MMPTKFVPIIAALAMVMPIIVSEGAKSMLTTSSQQLIIDLQSSDEEKAHAATSGIFSRGDSFIPALLALKGNKKSFAGASWLGRPTAGQTITSRDRNEESGTGVPVEIAALYLISAIYHDKLTFAQSPYLTDLTVAPDKRKAKNSQVLIDRAWRSTEAWAGLLKSQGIERLRKEKRSPLDGSQTAFW